MLTLSVPSSSPMEDAAKQEICKAVGAMSYTELKNLQQLVKSPKAKSYLANDKKFAKLKIFI